MSDVVVIPTVTGIGRSAPPGGGGLLSSTRIGSRIGPLIITALALLGGICLDARAQATPAAPSAHQGLVNRYCVTCHNEKLRTAKLSLAQLDVAAVEANAAIWEKVARKLRTGAMPPAGVPRTDKVTLNSLAGYLETELDKAVASDPNPGRI